MSGPEGTTVLATTAIKDFGELFTKGIKYLSRACRVYVKAIDENPEHKSDFEEAYPDISPSAWKKFEAVGRGALHIKLLTKHHRRPMSTMIKGE